MGWSSLSVRYGAVTGPGHMIPPLCVWSSERKRFLACLFRSVHSGVIPVEPQPDFIQSVVGFQLRLSWFSSDVCLTETDFRCFQPVASGTLPALDLCIPQTFDKSSQSMLFMWFIYKNVTFQKSQTQTWRDADITLLLQKYWYHFIFLQFLQDICHFKQSTTFSGRPDRLQCATLSLIS